MQMRAWITCVLVGLTLSGCPSEEPRTPTTAPRAVGEPPDTRKLSRVEILHRALEPVGAEAEPAAASRKELRELERALASLGPVEPEKERALLAKLDLGAPDSPLPAELGRIWFGMSLELLRATRPDVRAGSSGPAAASADPALPQIASEWRFGSAIEHVSYVFEKNALVSLHLDFALRQLSPALLGKVKAKWGEPSDRTPRFVQQAYAGRGGAVLEWAHPGYRVRLEQYLRGAPVRVFVMRR